METDKAGNIDTLRTNMLECCQAPGSTGPPCFGAQAAQPLPALYSQDTASPGVQAEPGL